MHEYELWFVLLLALCWFFETEGAVVKTVGREPDVTPICSSATLHTITLIVCKIRTKMSKEGCRLLYQYGQDFEHECDSRFTLMTKNQSVFLHLTSLTPLDSGNYTCECSHAHGTDVLHLIITVEGDEEAGTSSVMMLISTTLIIGGAAFIIVTGVVVGLILKKQYCRDDTTSGQPGLSVCETSSLDKDDPDNPYMSLRRPTSDLYQTLSSLHHQHDGNTSSAGNNIATVHLEQETDGRETDQKS